MANDPVELSQKLLAEIPDEEATQAIGVCPLTRADLYLLRE